MTRRKTLLFVLLLLFGSVALNLYAQPVPGKGTNTLKENFERYGWWENYQGNPVYWETKWTQWPGQTTPTASSNSSYTWGPNRARWDRVNLSDTTVFSAFASRRTQFASVPPSNYESTYVAGIHSYMQTTFAYQPTIKSIGLKFSLFANIMYNAVLNRYDSFYVAVKRTLDPDVKSNWKFIYVYTNKAGDPISGSEKWYSIDVKSFGDTLAKYWTTNQNLNLRFGFISYNNPEKIGSDSTRSPRAYGVWVDNVDITEGGGNGEVLGMGFHNVGGFTISDPAVCEKLKFIVGARLVNVTIPPGGISVPWKFTSYNGTNTTPVKTYSGNVLVTTNFDPWFYPFTDLIDMSLYPSYKIRIVFEFAGATLEKTYDLKHVTWGPLKIDASYNNAMYPEPALPKVKTLLLNSGKDTTGVNAFWLEKYYNLDKNPSDPANLTQVSLDLTRINGFDLTTLNLTYSVEEAYQVLYDNVLGKEKLVAYNTSVVNSALVPESGWEILFRHKGWKEFTNKAFMNVIIDDIGKTELNTRISPYLVKLKISALVKDRYNNLPSNCAQEWTVYAIVPRDYMLIPKTDYETFAQGIANFQHTVQVWRFNKHNKNVVLHFYQGGEFSTASGPVTASYTAALKENAPAPMTPRPRITETLDKVYLSRTVTEPCPTTAANGIYNRVVMYGYDNDILADAYYNFRIYTPPPKDFTLKVVPTKQNVIQGDCATFEVQITRINMVSSDQICFAASDITSNPQNTTLSYQYSLDGLNWLSSVCTNGTYVYVRQCTQYPQTPVQQFVITLKGTFGTLSKTAVDTLNVLQKVVFNNWFTQFKIREWNTFNAVDSFWMGMHNFANKGLDPANLWPTPYINEALKTLPTDPFLFSFQFKLDTTVNQYSKNEYKTLNESQTVTTVYNFIISGRWPFLIQYKANDPALQYKEIQIVDKFSNGSIYNQTIKYDATKNWVDLPLINDWALNGFWYLEFRLKYKATPGSPTDVAEQTVIPAEYSLEQNYPNPFNPATVISYSLPKDEFVKLVVVNSIGEVVSTLVNDMQSAGKKTVTFNAQNLPSGVYYYKLQAGSFVETRKMMLVK